MGRITDNLKSTFGFLLPKSRKEELVAEHVIREHHRGRSLPEILKDPYVTNQLEPDKIDRVLERHDVIEAIGQDMVDATRRLPSA